MKDIKFVNPNKFDDLANVLADKIKLLKDIDLIVSVPKFEDEKNETDFSLKIAETVSEKTNIPYSNDIITKIKKTRKLKTIPQSQREKEIENSFEINSKYDLTNKKICIVDDVYSSGYTLKEIIKTLSKKVSPTNISVGILVLQK